MRSKDGYSPTEQALILLPEAQLMMSAYQSLLRQISEEKSPNLSGTIRLAVSEVMAGEIIPEMLTKFQETHPLVKIELSVSNKTDNLLSREADLAVRMTEPKQVALISQKLGVIPIRFYAHRKYVSKYGKPHSIEDLKRHKLIGPDLDTSYFDAFQKQGIYITREQLCYRTDNQLVQLQLLRKGLGICVMQENLAKKEKDLIHLFKSDVVFRMPVWLVMHEDLKLDRKIRALFTFLSQQLKEIIPNTL